jgi:hypothetical protein
MTLSTYSDLSATVTDWLDDANLASKVDTFIQLAEARFNRVIRHTDMESFTVLSASAETLTLPTDATAIKIIWIDGSPDQQLVPMSLSDLKKLYGGISGTPQAFAVAGGNLYLGPVPSSSTDLATVYYAKISNLSLVTTTNWLLASHPDIYLYACLVMAEARGWNDGRLPLLKSALDEAIAELTTAGQAKRYGGAPLQARAAITA